jgi:shikimate dehydrogenase
VIPTGKAQLAGVIGWPIAHSRSPRLHGFWLDRLGIDGAYVPLAVRPDDLALTLRLLPRLGFRGCNLTLPHKEAALGLVDTLSTRAARIGAINTVIVGPDDKLTGDNTDGFGFIENLKAAGVDPAAGTAVVLGAGGGARAVVAALLDAGAPKVAVANRGAARAEALARALGSKVTTAPWERRAEALAGAALLVNTTSLGMTGQPPLEIDLARLPPGAAVSDLVYVPLETPLLARAKARGLKSVDGLGMLLHQARPGFAAWFGREPEDPLP